MLRDPSKLEANPKLTAVAAAMLDEAERAQPTGGVLVPLEK